MYTLGILYLVPYPQAHRVFRLPSHSFILMFPDFGRKSQILSYIWLCLCYSRIWFINKYFVKINFEVSPMFRQTPYPSMISDVFRWYWNHLMALVTVNTPWPWRSSQAWRHLVNLQETADGTISWWGVSTTYRCKQRWTRFGWLILVKRRKQSTDLIVPYYQLTNLQDCFNW